MIGAGIRCTLAALVFFAVGASSLEAAPTRSVTLHTDDGVTISGTFFEGPRRPAPAVILLHMLTRTRDDWEAFANRLADAGIHALAIDFRGHGASSSGVLGADGEPDLTRLILDVQAARVVLLRPADALHRAGGRVKPKDVRAGPLLRGKVDSVRSPIDQVRVFIEVPAQHARRSASTRSTWSSGRRWPCTPTMASRRSGT